MDSIELMFAAKNAIKIGRLVEAEQLLRQAVDLLNWRKGKPTGAFSMLGDILYHKGELHPADCNYSQAIPSDLPACKGMIRIRREWARQSAEDLEGMLRWYNQMLSIAWLRYKWLEIQIDFADQTYADHLVRWKNWRDNLVMQYQTPYPFIYSEHGAPPADKLLTKTDYKKIHQLTFGVGAKNNP